MTEPALDFSGRSALVTGAGSGIGAAVARWLDAHGIATLHLVDVNAEGMAALDLSCEVHRHVHDVSDPQFWGGFERAAGTLDHAVVNAGIALGGAPIAEQTFQHWRRVMAVNLDGAFLTLAAALRLMQANGGGSAVVTSSITAIKPVPGIGAYGVSKAGVAHMTRIAAAENAARGIRVNAVAPGGVDTAIWDSGEAFRKAVEDHGREGAIAAMGAGTPRGRFATADEIAGDIGYLLSDMAANVTGVVLNTDGGFSL
ncbi:Levodione reductase [Tsuneonella dongtanensis]|uniref:Levodione reductase n=1 Tax=Tsuneonella dongtanensis TaxID=692370 RepID=A0A1B2ADJ0_9SPHN|nr:SDR family oxidoreductase [Tsuneonella dongtanensis]ANY20115.1 Levodione reductase [Tsuneonella dongtanensis]